MIDISPDDAIDARLVLCIRKMIDKASVVVLNGCGVARYGQRYIPRSRRQKAGHAS